MLVSFRYLIEHLECVDNGVQETWSCSNILSKHIEYTRKISALGVYYDEGVEDDRERSGICA